MQSNCAGRIMRTFYVHCSGLFAVPEARVHEVRKLREEYFQHEAQAAMTVSMHRRMN